MKIIHWILTALILVLAACDEGPPTSDQIANKQQELLSKQSVQEVGLPNIVNFQEKKNLKMILEKRDLAKLTTFTYLVDLNGHMHLLCASIGYGTPYSTQFTNPMKAGYYGQGGITALPQADPNGLFSPASAEGTWVMCQNPNNKADVQPVYVEPRIITSPFAFPGAL